jgi:hypothetical protein
MIPKLQMADCRLQIERNYPDSPRRPGRGPLSCRASVETAKEVKIFGLNAFLIERYKTPAEGFYRANRALARRRALWGGLLTTVGTMGSQARPPC